MIKQLFVLLALLGWTVSACRQQPTAAGSVAADSTANPALVATAQADQYWRDAQATMQAYQVTLEANYRYVQGTAQAGTGTAVWQAAQGTATSQAQQTG